MTNETIPKCGEATANALAIWQAGVEAVRSETLVRNCLKVVGSQLHVADRVFDLTSLGRIAVVGAGKAGAGMAAAAEAALGPQVVAEKVTGWVNVPADCVRKLSKIHLHAARPAGVNEPTREGVAGSEAILNLVGKLGPSDLCLVLISGGGSALLPAPVEGVSLADKAVVTRLLMHRGATINELNTVRKKLSRIKGGGLARATRAGSIITLIISDVIGDPLDVIASGPTVEDTAFPNEALQVLRRFAPQANDVPASVWNALERAANRPAAIRISAKVENIVIGNNAVALDAAAKKARELGYAVHSLGSNNQGEAAEVGRDLLEACQSIRDQQSPVAPPCCVLSGGEPIVQLTPHSGPRKGGRNQHLVLAAANTAWNTGLEGIVLLSGGTDGEDGPTDAAGAWVNDEVLANARRLEIVPATDLAIHNAYHFFDEAGGLLKTGPTHTNVMDLRVGIISAAR